MGRRQDSLRYSGRAMKIRFCILGLLALLAPRLQLFAADESPELLYSGADEGIALIECRPDGSSLARRQRGALIDYGEADVEFEVVLTTAHGMPGDMDSIDGSCALVAGEDSRLPIVAMWRPETHGRGSTDDWAVLISAGGLSGRAGRLRTLQPYSPELEELMTSDASVRLPLRFPPGERACELKPSKLTVLDVRAGLFAHNCISWAGHSGSPVLVNVEGKPVVLGLHLGSRWLQADQISLKIGRYIDTAIVTAINDAVAHGRSLAAETDGATDGEPQGWLQRLLPR